ncbi:MFS transporter [Geodermatophilus marinus]|nr:MFS transporter [Geodermatophilus sp. LHW52908]
MLLDGFDLVVVGAVLPTLQTPEEWGLGGTASTLVVTVGLVGMMIGALLVGSITDAIGRRRALIGAVASFSLFTLLCAVAPGPGVFGVFRFLAGLGLGGCLPTAIAMVNEFTRAGRSGRATTTVMTGYHVGAVVTAALAIVVVEPVGWRWMFVVGGLPGLLLVPVMLRHLPESAAFLLSQGRREEAEDVARRYRLEAPPAPRPRQDPVAGGASFRLSLLFTGEHLRNTLAIGVTSFMGLLLVYGLNTWLPTIMREADYELGTALAFLLVLNVGAIAGLLVAGAVADRVGARRAGIAWFAGGALFLALLSVRLPTVGLYALVLLTGCFVFSAQVLVYAFVSANNPPQLRATALGWSAGAGRVGAIVGPVLTGALYAAGLAFPWGFYVFAGVGVLGALGISLARAVRT